MKSVLLRFGCVALLTVASSALAQTTQPAGLFDYDRGTPSGKIVESKDSPTYKREKIFITTAENDTIPAILSLPLGPGPFPVVVAIHGAYADRKERMIDRFATRLNRAGIACIAYDLPGHGQRVTSDATGFRRSLGVLLLDMAVNSGRTVPPAMKILLGLDGNQVTPKLLDTIGRGVAHSVTDGRRVIDYVQTRPDLDSARIGVAGVSLGGSISVLLADVDSRVIAASLNVAGGWPMLAQRVASDPALKALYEQIDVRLHAAKLSPKPVLMINGRQDNTVTPDNAQSLFDSLGHPKKISWYAAGHNLPGPAFDEASAWLSTWLKKTPATQPTR